MPSGSTRTGPDRDHLPPGRRLDWATLGWAEPLRRGPGGSGDAHRTVCRGSVRHVSCVSEVCGVVLVEPAWSCRTTARRAPDCDLDTRDHERDNERLIIGSGRPKLGVVDGSVGPLSENGIISYSVHVDANPARAHRPASHLGRPCAVLPHKTLDFIGRASQQQRAVRRCRHRRHPFHLARSGRDIEFPRSCGRRVLLLLTVQRAPDESWVHGPFQRVMSAVIGVRDVYSSIRTPKQAWAVGGWPVLRARPSEPALGRVWASRFGY